MPIYFGLLALAVLLSLAVWGAILWWVSRVLGPADYVPTPIAKRVAAFGRVAFQLIVASFAVYLWAAPGVSLGSWLLGLFIAPVAAPAIVLYFWNSYFSFLGPLIPATLALSAAVSFAWAKLVPARLQMLWPTIAVLCIVVVSLLLAEFQFRRDVAEAAGKLAPDCLDGGSILDAIKAARPQGSGLYVRASKDGAVYGWSFRQRDFYSLPKSIPSYYPVVRSEAFLSDYPSCWPKNAEAGP